MNQKESILIVDDDKSTSRSLQLIFGKKGYDTEIAGTAQEALERIKKKSFNVALIDIRLPDMEGTVLLGKLKKAHPEMACMVITGYASLETAIITIKLGSNGYFVKPLVMEEVIYRLEEALDKQRMERKLKESEQKYRTLYESSKDGIAFCNIEGNFLDVNQAFLDMLGYSIEEIKRLTYQKLTPKRWHKTEAEIFKNQIMKRGYSDEYEKENIKKDGTSLPITIRLWLIKDEQERSVGTWGIIRDITDRKDAEETLQRYEHIVSSSTDMLALLDKQFTYLAANKAYIEAFKLTPKQLIGNSVAKVFGEEFFNVVIKPNASRCLGGEKVNHQNWIDFPAYGRRYMDVNYYPYYSKDKKVMGFVVNGRDITERKRAKEELEESEKRYRNLIESTYDLVQSVSPDGRFLFVNRAWQETLGYTEAELPGINLWKIIHPQSLSHCQEMFSQIIKGKSIKNIQTTFVAKDGNPIQVEGNVIGRYMDGKLIATYGFFRDITKRKQAEEEQRLHAAMMANVAEGVYLIGLDDLRIKWTNERFTRMFGYDPGEMVGKKVDIVNAPTERTPDETRISIVDVLKETGEWHGEVKNIKRDGTHFWCYANVSLFDHPEYGKIIVAAHTDITGRKKAIEEIEELAKFPTENPNPVLRISKDGTVLYHNYPSESLLRQWHYKEGNPLQDRWLRFVLDALEDDDIKTVETKIGDKIISLTFAPIIENDFVNVYGLDITERKKAEERLRKSMDATIDTMSKIIEARDPYTSGHQHRVCQLAVPLAQELGLSEDKVEGVRIASLIHDIGKISLPTEILSKPTKLTDIEFSLIKDHSRIGYDILKSIEFSYPIAKTVLQHHERLDGTGYPNKVKGDEIILEAKIIGIADVVEAMSSHRPYRPALGIDAALEEISKNKGIFYDPKVVDICLKLFKEKGFKFK